MGCCSGEPFKEAVKIQQLFQTFRIADTDSFRLHTRAERTYFYVGKEVKQGAKNRGHGEFGIIRQDCIQLLIFLNSLGVHPIVFLKT